MEERSNSNKKLKSNGGEIRSWAELEKDVLLTIYQKLDVKDLVIGAPLCCASWYKASKDPSLWKDVDCRFFDYGAPYKQIQPLDLVDFVITRSHGLLNSIKFPSNRNSSVKEFLRVAERCPRLKDFELFMPNKTIRRGKDTIHVALSKLKELESMQVQDYFLSDEARLNQIAQYCPKLRKLKISTTVSEKTAALISKSLPKLKVIDLSDTRTQRDALLVILKDCKDLESLDVSRCDAVIETDSEIQKLARRLKEFKWDDSYEDDDPWGLNYLGMSESDSDSESERNRNRIWIWNRRGARAYVDYDHYDPLDYY